MPTHPRASTILHLADLHFGNPSRAWRTSELIQSLGAFIGAERARSPVILLITGDITFQARQDGYAEAKAFISELLDLHLFERGDVVLCPGNHDLFLQEPPGRALAAFDEFSAAIRSDTDCTYSNESVRTVRRGGLTFLLINSAYHGSEKSGLVDLDGLKNALEALCNDTLLIAAAHHHFVPHLRGDHSAVENAYGVLRILSSKGVSLLAHGHQHADLQLTLGEHSMLVSGVSSLGFVTPGYANGFALYRIDAATINRERYALTKDAQGGIVRLM